jgi:hypothetical protein
MLGGKRMIKAIKLKKIVIFVIIFFIIFSILYYKNFLFGNNIIKNRSNKIEEILNSMDNYCAEVNVIVTSNKTQNLYVMYQEVKENFSSQEIKEGDDIEGLKIELNQNSLKISNTKLNLEKVYENYNNLLNNAMFLNSFANDYRDENNTSNCYEENGELILEVNLENNQNTYIKYKKLYIDSNTLKPIKLEIKSHLKKETICIVYNNIELKKV